MIRPGLAGPLLVVLNVVFLFCGKSRSKDGCLTYGDIINIAITLSIMEISEI